MNQGKFRESLKEPALMRELIDLFPVESTMALESARTALTAGDAEALHHWAHKLKGMVGVYEAKRAWEAAMRLDTLARQGDLQRAQSVLTDCEREVALLRDALADFRAALV
jgi:HPt (histidine-containing phosphotransfer) domain-containing protein